MPSVEKKNTSPFFKRLGCPSPLPDTARPPVRGRGRGNCAWSGVSPPALSPMATAGGAPPPPPALIERGESILTAAEVRVVS